MGVFRGLWESLSCVPVYIHFVRSSTLEINSCYDDGLSTTAQL